MRFSLFGTLAVTAAVLACGNGGAPDAGGTTDGSSSSNGTGGTSNGGNANGSSSTGGSTGRGTSSGTSGGSSGGTSGGTSGGGSTTGGSTGGTSGAFDGGFCNGHAGGIAPEFGYCFVDTDCNCPFACNPDDAPFGLSGGPGSVCEYPCTSNADCPDAFTACQGGYCAYDLCDVSKTVDGSAPNGSASGVCSTGSASYGTCIVDDDPRIGVVIAICVQSGASTTSCDSSASRFDAGSLCVVGDICVVGPDAGTSGSCQPGCDPTDGGACPSGLGCGALDPTRTFLNFGACFTQAGSCLQGFPFDNEMSGCSPNAGCGCLGALDVECFPDPTLGTALNPYGAATYCERFCSTTSDCAIPSTICRGNWCSYDFCGHTPSGQDAGSGYDLPCDAAGQGDGTCLPIATSTADPAYGLCLQGGPATASCSVTADRTTASGLCGPANYCEPLGNGGAGCLPACNPKKGSNAPCSGGLACVGVQSGASVAFGTCQ